MVSPEEIEEYYEKHYQNQKRGTSLNINKQLKIDFQIVCSELSRKSKKTITPSAEVRKMMVEFILKNKRKN